MEHTLTQAQLKDLQSISKDLEYKLMYNTGDYDYLIDNYYISARIIKNENIKILCIDLYLSDYKKCFMLTSTEVLNSNIDIILYTFIKNCYTLKMMENGGFINECI